MKVSRIAALIFILLCGSPAFAQQCQVHETAGRTNRFGAQTVGTDLSNQCCVQVQNIYTGASDCFCTCPGDIENTGWGSLVCQVRGRTYFLPASDVSGQIVDDCSYDDIEPVIEELEILLELPVR